MGNKTTNIYNQRPVCNGFYIVSELNNVLKSGYYHSPLGYENVDWFVYKMIKLENKMNFYFKNTKKDIVMSEEDEEHFRNTNICWFCEKEFLNTQSKIDPDQRLMICNLKDFSDGKVRDFCILTGKYRGPAHLPMQYKCQR